MEIRTFLMVLVLLLADTDNTAMQRSGHRQTIIAVLALIMLTVALFAIIPQLHGFAGSWHVLRMATPATVVVAILFVYLAYVCSAAVYGLLSFKRLAFADTLLVQLAGLFVNRVVPAGIGGMGLNFLYLRRRRQTATQAATVVALNDLLGAVGHVVLFAVMIGLLHVYGEHLTLPAIHLQAHAWWLIPMVTAFVVLGYVVRSKRVRGIRSSVLRQLRLIAKFYARSPGRLALALLVSLALTLCTVLGFLYSCQAVGATLSLPVIFVIFTVGVVFGTAVPTPGGLGGTEAGLLIGLTSQHINGSAALAAVLLYRLISFWPGLVIGAGALVVVRRKRLV